MSRRRFDPSPDPVDKAIEYSRQIRNLLYWYQDHWKPFEQELADAGFDFSGLVSHSSFENLDGFALLKKLATDSLPNAISVQQKRLRKTSIVSELDQILALLAKSVSTSYPESIASQLLDAVVSRDAPAYQEGYTLLVDVYTRRDPSRWPKFWELATWKHIYSFAPARIAVPPRQAWKPGRR